MGWGGFAEKITGILDGMLGLSPEQKKRKIKDEIDKLEQEKSLLLVYKADAAKVKRLTVIELRLVDLNKRLQNFI
jgi:predicted Co/Zn/Cd cation transporter (cation efflux family)